MLHLVVESVGIRLAGARRLDTGDIPGLGGGVGALLARCLAGPRPGRRVPVRGAVVHAVEILLAGTTSGGLLIVGPHRGGDIPSRLHASYGVLVVSVACWVRQGLVEASGVISALVCALRSPSCSIVLSAEAFGFLPSQGWVQRRSATSVKSLHRLGRSPPPVLALHARTVAAHLVAPPVVWPMHARAQFVSANGWSTYPTSRYCHHQLRVLCVSLAPATGLG